MPVVAAVCFGSTRKILGPCLLTLDMKSILFATVEV